MPNGGGGDYARWNGFYQRKNADLRFAAADTGPFDNVIAVKSPNHQIWIQKITLSLAEHAAQIISFVDDDAAAVVPAPFTIAAHDDTVELATLVWDFGPQGTPLNVGANLDITLAAAGLGGVVHIEAYEVLAEPMAYGPNN